MWSANQKCVELFMGQIRHDTSATEDTGREAVDNEGELTDWQFDWGCSAANTKPRQMLHPHEKMKNVWNKKEESRIV